MSKDNKLIQDTLSNIFSQNDYEMSPAFKDKKLSKEELELALAVLLVDLASCDQDFDLEEYQTISAGLKRMFGTDKEKVQALVNQSKLVLDNLRGTNSFAKQLQENLSDEQKKTVLEIIEDVVHADGQEDGFETYLRTKFKDLLGID